MFTTHISDGAAAAVSATLASTLLSEGKVVRDFETALGEQLGLTNPVAVNSGTAALHLALEVAGVGPGHEVILPPQTFIASGLAVLMAGAKPIFADIQYETGNIDPALVRERISPRTRAIMPVHWGGYPCDLSELTALAHEFGLVVIDDAAHALGATYKGAPVGSGVTDVACFSFQAIKHVTTGDGGLVCARSVAHAKAARTRRWFGIDRDSSPMNDLGERRYDVAELGFKYHMNDYCAALGLANLSGFADRLGRLRQIHATYRAALRGVPGVKLFRESEDRQSACWLFGMHVEARGAFVQAMADRGVTASVVHQRIDRNRVFGGVTPGLHAQERFDASQVHLPCHTGLTDEMVDHIIQSVAKGWSR